MTQQRFPILWLTGNTGAGKTTLATGLERYWNDRDSRHPWCRRVLVLDGDEMRATVSLDETLSATDRRAHNLRVARLAGLMQKKGFLVVVAVIAPYQSVRKEIDAICGPLWIYVKRSGLSGADRPYEIPTTPHCTIDHDMLSKEEALQYLMSFLKGFETGYSMKKYLKKRLQAA